MGRALGHTRGSGLSEQVSISIGTEKKVQGAVSHRSGRAGDGHPCGGLVVSKLQLTRDESSEGGFARSFKEP